MHRPKTGEIPGKPGRISDFHRNRQSQRDPGELRADSKKEPVMRPDCTKSFS
uniref:Uncharacterized protein n=1 Tax=Faecalibaculum rodentium TaxID=1702221 RepID=A0A140DS01_9FIRM|nr:hypothetical protein AALO17_02940 [Faecalibaculum rodentium]